MIDEYLSNIKTEIINGNAKVVAKNYQINNVKGIVKKYAKELTEEFGTNYGITNLKYMRLFYYFIKKGHAMHDELSWNHYKILISLKKLNEINYYVSMTIRDNLNKRALN